jgi:hypothetical protein
VFAIRYGTALDRLLPSRRLIEGAGERMTAQAVFNTMKVCGSHRHEELRAA